MEPADLRTASDEELAEAAQGGEVRALDALLDRHGAKVLRVLGFLGIRAQDREDAAQEIFIRVFRHLGSYRRGLPFGAWLYRVTVNAAHDFRRRQERQTRGEADDAEPVELPDPSAGPADRIGRRDLRRALLAAMENLSDRERAVFVLREIEGLETAVVARSLGITAITVRRHLGRARRRLQKALRLEPDGLPISIERIAPGRGSQG